MVESFSGYEGWQFRAARAAAGLTAKEVIALSGVASATLQRIEGADQVMLTDLKRQKGRIRRDHVQRLCDVFAKHGFQIVPAKSKASARVEGIRDCAPEHDKTP